jgi:hypothetical protein
MSPTPVPTRTIIDFRADIHPSRGWILGLDDTDRADLLGFAAPPASSRESSIPEGWRGARPSNPSTQCACPDFCERDHPNE